MKQWVNISDAVEITNNRVKPFKGERRYLATGDLIGDAVNESIVSVDYDNKPSRADLLVEEGNVIVARMQATNKVLLIDEATEDLIVSTGFLTLQPKKEFDGSYLAHYFRSDLFQKKKDKYCSGATQKAINNGAFAKLQVPSYSLDEQRRISNILDQADALRQKRKQAVQLLDDFLRATFLDMFGDPVVNDHKWRVAKFSQVGTLDRGISKHRPRNAPELLGGPYPLIQTGDVANSGGYIRLYKSTYSDLGLKQSKMWPIGTLCITIAANIAKTGVLTFRACFPDSVVGFAPNDMVKTEYVQYWMSFLQKILEEKAPESAQKNINLEILRNLDIPVPPIDLQNKFTLIVNKTEETKQEMQTSQAELDNQFSALTQRCFG